MSWRRCLNYPRTAAFNRKLNSWFRFNPLTEIHNTAGSVQDLAVKVPAMEEHALIVEDDECPTEEPHPTDAEVRKCSICGFTRRDAPSALNVCCGQPMELEAVEMAAE